MQIGKAGVIIAVRHRLEYSFSLMKISFYWTKHLQCAFFSGYEASEPATLNNGGVIGSMRCLCPSERLPDSLPETRRFREIVRVICWDVRGEESDPNLFYRSHLTSADYRIILHVEYRRAIAYSH
jgi:hypothetical protein